MKKTQEEVQKEAVQALKEHNGGTVHVLTGGGKNKIMIDFLMTTCKPYDTVLITVPLTTLIKNIKDEFKKWTICEQDPNGDLIVVVPNGYITVTIVTINSAYKVQQKVSIHVLDEIHTQVTTEYSSVFENVTCNTRIGLTATTDTLRRSDKQEIYDKYCPIVYEYLDGEADGVVNKTQFKIIEHKLNDIFKVETGPKHKKFFVGEKKQYEYLTNQIKAGQAEMAKEGSSDYWKDASEWFWNKNGNKAQIDAGRKYLGSITNRRKFLVSLQSSAEIAKRLAKQIILENEANKVLVFSEEVKQLKKICKYNVYGEQDSAINDEILAGFNDGNIRAIGSCYSLTLGVNLIGANNSILESYNGSDTKATQRIGRLHRLEKDHVATIWIVKIVGTQSEQWFDSMMYGYALTDAEIITSDKILK